MKAQRFDLVLQQWMDRDVPGRTVLLNFSREQEDGLPRQAAIVKIEIHLFHDRTVIDCAGMICELAYREKKLVGRAVERWVGLTAYCAGGLWPLEAETAAKLVVIWQRGMGMAMLRRSPVAGGHDYY